MKQRVSAHARAVEMWKNGDARKKKVEMLRRMYPNAVTLVEAVADGYESETVLRNMNEANSTEHFISGVKQAPGMTTAEFINEVTK